MPQPRYLTTESIQEVRNRSDLQKNLRVFFLRMMNFYRFGARSASLSRPMFCR
jgi:hypothetical protein